MEPAPLLRRSRTLAAAAFTALATALWLPWWRVEWRSGGTLAREEVRAFGGHAPLTTEWGPWLTGLLAAAALGLLFVRLAARSWVHEPPAWRRGLGAALGLVVAALASTLLWPAGVPSFWGGRTYAAANATGPATVETAMPGLGWWTAAAAAALLAGAFLAARRAAAGEGNAP